MKSETFKKGMSDLVNAFPGMKLNLNFYWEKLKNLSDDEFLRAVDDVVLNVQDLFSTSNLVAILRVRTEAFKKPKMSADEFQEAISGKERFSAPPPADFLALGRRK